LFIGVVKYDEIWMKLLVVYWVSKYDEILDETFVVYYWVVNYDEILDEAFVVYWVVYYNQIWMIGAMIF